MSTQREERIKVELEKIREAAEQGIVEAQYDLANMYEHGEGVEQSNTEAITWFMKAAEQGDAESRLRLEKIYEKSHSLRGYGKALIAAEQGDAEGEYKIGMLFLEDDDSGDYGINRNNAIAFRWIHKAAEKGHVAAQNRLAWMYARGKGVEINWKLSFEWSLKAAEQGLAAAQHTLGAMYAQGLGTDKDDELATEWYRKSSEQSYMPALKGLDLMVDKKIACAQYNWGMLFEIGVAPYIKKDIAGAIKWYQKAAEQGYIKAQKRLAELDIL